MAESNENFQVRDFFNHKAIQKLAAQLDANYNNFKTELFLEIACHKLDTRTYSERKNNIVAGLNKTLPTHFPDALNILLEILPPPYESEDNIEAIDRFMVAPIADYVGLFGLDNPKIALEGLYKITKTFTSEWGIRPFLVQHRDMTLSHLHEWTNDPNPHVRRLVSEGSRPYLPWGKKLAFVEKDPETTLPLLRKLKSDKSEYVRRSVANHLNDLTKKHSCKIIEELSDWEKENSDKNMAKLIRHALRSAIKDGHPKALELLGYSPNSHALISEVIFTQNVPFTGKFEFQFNLVSKEKKSVKIMLDFIIHYQKANGTTQPKVFKLRDLNLSPNEVLSIKKTVSFKPITTRKYYPGLHYIQFLINGNLSVKHKFYLENP